jgi:cytochrome d ubiquinol oxidase subunit II
MWRRHILTVRVSAALAVTALLWRWGLGQYPSVLPGLALAEVSDTESVLMADTIAVGIAGILVIRSLWWLYAIFQRDQFANRR